MILCYVETCQLPDRVSSSMQSKAELDTGTENQISSISSFRYNTGFLIYFVGIPKAADYPSFTESRLSYSDLCLCISLVCGSVVFICVCSIARTGCRLGPNGPNATIFEY